MSASVLVGAADPEALQITVSSATVDLTDVTGSTVLVTPPGEGAAATWVFTIESSTETSIVLRHVYASDGSDVTAAGTYKIRIRLTFPASVTRRVRTVSLVAEAW